MLRSLIKFSQLIRDLQILRRERLRLRDFLNTKQCSRVRQRHFGGKTWQPSSFYYEFQRECRSGGNKLSNVRSFSILQSGEGSTSFNNDNSANFSGEKKYNEEFWGVYFLIIREKTLNKISYSQSFSSLNLKVTIIEENVRKSVWRICMWILGLNPLSPDIHIQILQTDLDIIP